MAIPTTRTELKEYIRRQLGAPVITVNVSDEQIDDRINDAIALYQDYHYDGSEPTYLKHQITYSNVVFSTAITGTFGNNEIIKGSTSNAMGKIQQTSNTTARFHYLWSGQPNQFAVSETLVGQTTNASGVVSSVTLGDWDQRYVPVPSNIISINKIISLDGFAVDRGTGLFSWNYQFLMNDLSWLSSSSVVSYFLTRSHMEMLNDLFIGDKAIRFNRHVNKLYLDVDWNHDIHPGDYLVCEVQRALDPDTYPDIWNDRFLRNYATALVKRQWGQNMSKYEGIQMPGGVTISGQRLFDQGDAEAKALEEELRTRYQLPASFTVM